MTRSSRRSHHSHDVAARQLAGLSARRPFLGKAIGRTDRMGEASRAHALHPDRGLRFRFLELCSIARCGGDR
jgi:hypothetical protein